MRTSIFAFRNMAIIALTCIAATGRCDTHITLVQINATAKAIVVVPDHAEAIAKYAAEEFVWHVEQATGTRLSIVREADIDDTDLARVYIGATKAAAKAGIDVNTLPPEACVLRFVEGNLFIAGKDGPGDPLSAGHTHSGTLWGVYEVLEYGLGVRWLWPGELGIHIPKQESLKLADINQTIFPHYIQRQIRAGLGPQGFVLADKRLAFTKKQREQYAHDQNVFLRRHRMGKSPNTFFSEPRHGSGHAFGGWWQRYGKQHPEWFQQLPNGQRGPGNPDKPHQTSMCVSNKELQRKVVELWAEDREKRPGQPLGLGIGESDGSAMCQCAKCLAWDGDAFDIENLPAGLERSFLPVQASTRYARFAKEIHALASKIDPDVKVHYFAYLNYFWAPDEDVKLHKNIIIGFVPWFRWAGWFPRTEQEDAWIKQQWMGWQRTGASVFYRPNWFLEGYTMPHVFMHQFADTYHFYHNHGMIGTDFDLLQGMWAAQGPNLYMLARIQVRPEMPIDELLEEYYGAFGPAAETVRKYFNYWEKYALNNRARVANSIQSRQDGRFRRYAHYTRVTDELFPPEVFNPAMNLLDQARDACDASADPTYTARVEFLREGLEHSLQCVKTAAIVNDPQASPADRGRALSRLATYRRSLKNLNIANMDRAGIIETDSWKDVDGFAQPWPGQ